MKTTLRRLLRLLIAALVVLGLLHLASRRALPSALEGILEARLADLGLDASDLRVRSVGVDLAVLGPLEVPGLRIERLEASWSAASLRAGRLTRVRISGLSADLEIDEGGSLRSGLLDRLAERPASKEPFELPFDLLELADARCRLSHGAEFASIALSGAVRRGAGDTLAFALDVDAGAGAGSLRLEGGVDPAKERLDVRIDGVLSESASLFGVAARLAGRDVAVAGPLQLALRAQGPWRDPRLDLRAASRSLAVGAALADVELDLASASLRLGARGLLSAGWEGLDLDFETEARDLRLPGARLRTLRSRIEKSSGSPLLRGRLVAETGRDGVELDFEGVDLLLDEGALSGARGRIRAKVRGGLPRALSVLTGLEIAPAAESSLAEVEGSLLWSAADGGALSLRNLAFEAGTPRLAVPAARLVLEGPRLVGRGELRWMPGRLDIRLEKETTLTAASVEIADPPPSFPRRLDGFRLRVEDPLDLIGPVAADPRSYRSRGAVGIRFEFETARAFDRAGIAVSGLRAALDLMVEDREEGRALRFLPSGSLTARRLEGVAGELVLQPRFDAVDALRLSLDGEVLLPRGDLLADGSAFSAALALRGTAGPFVLERPPLSVSGLAATGFEILLQGDSRRLEAELSEGLLEFESFAFAAAGRRWEGGPLALDPAGAPPRATWLEDRGILEAAGRLRGRGPLTLLSDAGDELSSRVEFRAELADGDPRIEGRLTETAARIDHALGGIDLAARLADASLDFDLGPGEDGETRFRVARVPDLGSLRVEGRLGPSGATARVTGFDVTARLAEGELVSASGALRLDEGSLRHPELEIEAEGIVAHLPFSWRPGRLEGEESAWIGVASLGWRGRRVAGPEIELRPEGERIAISARVEPLPGLAATALGELEPFARVPRGRLDLRLPPSRLGAENQPSDLVAELDPVKLEGEIAAEATFELVGDRILARGVLDLLEVDASSADWDLDVEGISGRLRIRDLLALASEPHQRLRVRTLRTGEILLADGVLDIDIESPRDLFVEEMRWRFLNGLVEAHAFRLAPDLKGVDFELFCSDLSLRPLFALALPKKVEADGTVFGRVSVRIDWPLVHLGEGYLVAGPEGGAIRVLDDAMLENMLGGRLEGVRADAARSLRDFRFKTFRTRFERDDKGSVARIATEGRFQGLAAERPFRFDFNVHGLDRLAGGAMIVQEARKRAERGLKFP